MNSETLHPFEQAGMGCGPFRFLYVYEMPTPGDGSAAMFGNLDPYADAPKLKEGLGTCACCGMAISYVCVVRNAAGELYGVGSDCVAKTDDPHLGDAAKVEVARRQRAHRQAKAAARREAQRQVWLDQPSQDSRAVKGETNRQFHARLIVEQEAARAQAQAAAKARAATLADLLATLRAQANDFFTSLANQLEIKPLSERQAYYVAKLVVGRETQANAEAFSAVIQRCTTTN